MVDARMPVPVTERRTLSLAEALLDRRAAVVALTAAALAADVALIASGHVVRQPAGWAALVAEQGVAFAGAALFWRGYRPDSLIAPLLLAESLLIAGQGLQGAGSPALHSVGVLFDYPATLVIWFLLLAYPDGALGRLARASIATLAAAMAFGYVPLFLASSRPPGGAPLAACAGPCPRNVFFVGGEGAADVLRAVAWTGRIAATLLLIAALVHAYRRASLPRRRTLLPVSAISLAWVVPYTVYGIAVGWLGTAPGAQTPVGFALTVARAALPFAFLLGPLHQRAFAGQSLLRMIPRLNAAADPAARERVIAETLDDPTLRLAYWLPRSETWIDADGRQLQRDVGPQTWTIVRRGGEPGAALLHDPALADDPDLLAAAGRALLLVLDNHRLEGELDDLVGRLRESRSRLIAANVAERREIEHELHANAQQQLTALRLKLELAIETVDRESAIAQRLVNLGEALDDALAEVRRLAVSIYPPVLERDGLRAALSTAAANMDAPVAVDADEIGRQHEDVETTVYFCVVEALRHVLQHGAAGARADVRLRAYDSQLRFSVDSAGVALDPRHVRDDSALSVAADRVAAVGGSIELSATPNERSTLTGTVPARPREAA